MLKKLTMLLVAICAIVLLAGCQSTTDRLAESASGKNVDLRGYLMLGEVETVYGVLRNQQHPFIEAEDIGMAVLTFKNGAVATIEGTTNVYPKNLEETLYMFGEKGTVKLGGKSVNSIDVWDFSDELLEDSCERGLEEKTTNVYGNGHVSLYNNVINAIISGEKPLITAEDGKRAVEVVLAIYESARLKAPVTLPLKNVRTVDFTGLLNK